MLRSLGILPRTSDQTLSLDKISLPNASHNSRYIPIIMCLVSMLIAISTLMMYSAGGKSLVIAHLKKVAVILALFWTICQLNIHHLRRLSWPIYLISCLLLLTVALFGHVGKGAQRWISLSGFHFEPSELMKLALPVIIVNIIDKHREFSINTLIQVCAVSLIPVVLILKQPDLGTASVIMIISGCTLFLNGLPRRIIIGTTLLFSALTPVFWSMMHTYQKMRVLNLLHANFDPQNTGYHIHQSMIAIGSGGLFGKGFGYGSQVQLDFLPEHTTDFIFAHIAEEFGFCGCVLLLSLFIALITTLLSAAQKIDHFWARGVVQAVAIYIGVSTLINVGMVIGLLPVVGVPLPFISRGGSHLLLSMLGIAMVLVCIRYAHKDLRYKKD